MKIPWLLNGQGIFFGSLVGSWLIVHGSWLMVHGSWFGFIGQWSIANGQWIRCLAEVHWFSCSLVQLFIGGLFIVHKLLQFNVLTSFFLR